MPVYATCHNCNGLQDSPPKAVCQVWVRVAFVKVNTVARIVVFGMMLCTGCTKTGAHLVNHAKK